ncbi:MAG: rhomboid family intramembrane serine protease, partial [bacterium]
LLAREEARVRSLVFLGYFSRIYDIPAVLYLGGWFLLQLYGEASAPTEGGGGVAFMAHIGGFVAGLLLALIWPKAQDFEVQYEEFA